jgi:hypothetical protein
MAQAFRGSQSFGANVAFIQISFRVSFNFDDSVIFDPHQQGTAAMVHPGAVGFYPADIAFHFSILTRTSRNRKGSRFKVPS